MTLPHVQRANTLTIIAHAGGIEIASNGKKIFPMGGPDNNPTAQAILTADKFAQPLAAAQTLTDPVLQHEVQTALTEQLQDVLTHAAATTHKFPTCPQMRATIARLKQRLTTTKSPTDRQTLETIIVNDEELVDALCT